jgi:hypothetical protein
LLADCVVELTRRLLGRVAAHGRRRRLFPVVLLALLLITSGLEGRVVRQPTPRVGAGERPGTRDQG